MEIHDDTPLHRAANLAPEDHDLLDEFARSARRGWWFAVIVALDALAIMALVALVVIPKLT